MAARKVITPGTKFNRLTFLSDAGSSKKHRYAIFKCECGTEKKIMIAHVRLGKTVSCGCFNLEKTVARSTTHGATRFGKQSKTYMIWGAMKARCLDLSNKDYGGRGIKICDRWLEFENFLADMGEKPDGLSIDRINNDGNYEPSNCRWATTHEQAHNKRTNVFINHNGKCQTVSQWSEYLGINRFTIYSRIYEGKTIPMDILKK